ncbi:acyltransferase family protein [Bradyrhizobium sp. NP1]|uniref:acyltransferase family protein n=1 Tax=Bradyrhizobium sp. NP1 TaxID=3049772 RepID=UPI0025A5FC30|nr:acyltransferase family protein [Bradyrhizobium sp. NP1]WJR76056.1 acyltransferase family protein [Bradyrhizobium sp. NP1]
MTRAYREDIDALRALAVLSVIGFHFEAPRIFGGFIGVDVFFVISGFLITGIIQAEMREDSFSFARFYERRIRRLLPALYVMIAFSALPAMHFLLLSERLEFFRSAAAAVTFTSNIFFYLQAGYFDHAAVEKPLLHTWSLAVEEQFYLALPPILWAVMRLARGGRLALPVALAVLGGASLGLSIWLIANGRAENAFFLSPPRAWEFLVGSAIAVEGFPKVPQNRPLQHAIRGIAVMMILVPVFTYQQGPDFPGARALWPCLGAALFIWCGYGIPNRTRHPLSFLSLLRFCGQISYSLYLWHWPLFTFARFAKPSLTLDITEKTALFALTVVISYLSWRFVEQPFRDRTLAPTRRAAFSTALFASMALLAGSLGGFMLSRTPSDSDRAAARLDAYNAYDYKALYRYGQCFASVDSRFDGDCLVPAAGKLNLLLWGDSLAAHYRNGFEAIDPNALQILQATQPACMPTLSTAAQAIAACGVFAARMAAFFSDIRPDLVILSADWLEYARPPRFDAMIADLRSTIARLRAMGIRVVLLGPAVQYRARLPSMLARAERRGIDAKPDDLVLADIFALDRMMAAALPNADGFAYISVVDAVCPARQCPLTIADGIPVSWDHAHLTPEGSAYVVARIAPQAGLKTAKVVSGRD